MHINRFIANIDNMARQNQFEIEMFCPQIGLKMRGIRCKATALPGKSFETAPFGEIPAGAKKQYPTSVVYPQDITLTFNLDSSFEDKVLMELWQKSIYMEDYSLRYPDKYEGTVKIKQLASNGLPIYKVTLHRAWPQAISNSTLDMESGAIQTFDVTFAYRTWSARSYFGVGILGGILNQGRDRLVGKIGEKLTDKIYDKIPTGGMMQKIYKKIGLD